MTKFTDFPLIAPIQKAIKDAGYTAPTPIQTRAIPEILKGKDILGYAQTGTGKTAAFTLPIIQGLAKTSPRHGIKALIVTPTRELAIQIGENISTYSQHLNNVRHAVIFGGVNPSSQISNLKRGVQILVATPGRLLDLHSQGFIKLYQLDYFVLDEADRMLDMGFIHDIKRILKIIPEKRQTLFFSATMPKEIERLAARMLTNPMTIEIAQKSSTAERVEQQLYHVAKADKRKLLVHLLEDETLESVLVFTRTKHGADRVAKILNKAKVPAAAIHGNKSQTARQKALKAFKAREIRVLIATDIAARGIDVDSLSHVINYELPNIPETYVHRIGRTGRAGREGVAISFCDIEERSYVVDIEKLIRKRITMIAEHPFSENADAVPAPVEKPARRRPKPSDGRASSRSAKPKAKKSSKGPKREGARDGKPSHTHFKNKSKKTTHRKPRRQENASS